MMKNTEVAEVIESEKPRLFSMKQTGILIAFGIVFWFSGAMAVKFGYSVGLFGREGSLISFALAIPVSWLSVLLIIKGADLKPLQIVPGIGLGLATATFFDGIVLTWGTWVYGTNSDQISFGAAWILWGAFTFLAFAFFEAYRKGIKLA
ncbi:hypothetical protein IHV10_13330 [Fictibacillus sp. 5RED26]|uniref:hypothetical protein n=1 Tax=unclassified Fictibacillus TaxID=2644029 RepID=UPI0018CFAFE3|nr:MULTISPECIES: hypothetical protein [unclassified Fictibacillus]MBH0157355.1 hypothetical protein [Fictibacillus sp. 5RED26]MBH0166708.1 hypothetical protein [Fictibacillus sp. 7GRE50]